MGKEDHWLDGGIDILYQDDVYSFQFNRVSRKIWCVGQDHGQVFVSIDIFRLSVAPFKTGRGRDITVRVGRWPG